MRPEHRRQKPCTHAFQIYLRQTVTPKLREHVSRMQVSVFVDLLVYLEQQRYDYSADRAFQTRPLSNAQIAHDFDVTARTVRRWFRFLEQIGILARELRKNLGHAYRNLKNRLRFTGFKAWFAQLKSKAADSPCPPKREDIKHIPIKAAENVSAPDGPQPFPDPGTLRYSPYWYTIALQRLPDGRHRPCITRTAQKFRENLKQHGIPLSHTSVPKRWQNFCKRAQPVQ